MSDKPQDQSPEEAVDWKQKADDYLNSWKRAAADFENYKKRREKEDPDLVLFAKELTVAKLLPILDSLEQALRHMPQLLPASSLEKEEGQTNSHFFSKEGMGEFWKQYQSWSEGIGVMLKQLDKTLEELGVKKIEAVGKKFDPFRHEAVRHVDGEQDDMVVEEVQSGFELDGKVIRPSQVVVSKKVKSEK